MIERTRVQAVLLAAIMVLSMVAVGASGVAAQSPQPEDPVTAEVGDDPLQHSIDSQDNGSDTVTDDGPSVSVEPQQVQVADSLRERDGETVLLLSVQRNIDRETIRTGGVDAATLQSDSEATLRPVKKEIERLQDAEVRRTFWVGNVISVSVDLDQHDVEDIAAIDGVTSVSPNAEASHPTPAQTAEDVDTESSHNYTYGPAQIDVPGFEDRYGDEGGNASVAIIDDGMSDPEDGHPDIDIAEKAIAVDGQVQEGTLGTAGEHGEHVAGIATGAADPAGDVPRYGVAPNAELTMINAFQGQAAGEDILASVEYAVEEDLDVASMSLGFSSTTGNSVLQIAMENTMQDANAAGTLVIGSTGNAGAGEAGGPATSPGAEFTGFSIGGSAEDREMYASSSGDIISSHEIEFAGDGSYPETYPHAYVKPDVTAPGQDVLSAGPVGTPHPDSTATYSVASGTSMAAPHAAGAAVLIQSVTEEDVDPKLIESALEETAEKPDNDNPSLHSRDIRYGTGIINVTAATMAIEDDTLEVEGTVTDSGGDPLVGASVESDEGALTSTDEDGSYTLQTVEEPVNVTADAFGYEAATQTVTDDDQPVDFTLDDEFAFELLEGQNVYAAFGTEVGTSSHVRNVDTVTVDLSDETNVSEDDLTLLVDGQTANFSEPVEFDRYNGTLNVTVDIADDADVEEGSLIGLEHTYEGLGDTAERSTGPTTLTEELDPAHFELSNIQAPDSHPPSEPLPMTVEVTNTGQVSDTKVIQTFVGNNETEGTLTPQQIPLEPDETTTHEVLAAGLDGLFDEGQVIDAGFRTADGTNIVGSLVGINDEISTEVVLAAEGASFQVSDLDAPVQVDSGEQYEATTTVRNVGDQAGEQTVSYQFDGETVATETVQLDAFGPNASDNSAEVSFTASAPETAGIYSHEIATEDDAATAFVGVDERIPTATVVSTNDDYGGQTVDLLERGLGPADQPATVEYASYADVDEDVIDDTDVFVFHDLGDDSAELISTVEDSPTTTAVYLEQVSDSNAIAARSDALNDPESATGAYNLGSGLPTEFEIEQDHPLFDGVGGPGDRVAVHTGSDADRVYFDGASGETLAEVGVQGAATDGPTAAVDPESGSVLLGTIAPNTFEAESDFTDAGATILANAVGVANEDIVSDAVGETSIDAEFVGVVDDEEQVTVEATGVVAGGEPVDGEEVTLTVGGEPVATTTVDDGTAQATFDPATLDLDANETVEVGVEEYSVLEPAQVETVHETIDLQDGYNLLSVPQPATLSTEDVGAVNTWDAANNTYETVADATFDDYEDLHRGMYLAANDESARAGFTFSDDVPSGGTAEIAPGWTLASSNFAVDSVSQGDERTLDDDLLGVDPSWMDVFSADFDQRYDGNATIGGYDVYWTHNEADDGVERSIVSPSYDREDRSEVLGQEASNFEITDIEVVSDDGASQDDEFLGAGEGDLTIEATVENTGGADVQFVDLAVDDQQNGTFERVDRSGGVALDQGESETVTLTHQATHEDAPAIDLRVETEDDVSAPVTHSFDGGVFAVSDQALTLHDELVVDAVDVGGDATLEVVANDTVVGSRAVSEENDTDVEIGLDDPVTGPVDVRLLDAAGERLADETVTITEPTIVLDATGPSTAGPDEAVDVDVEVQNDALVEESDVVELTVDGELLDDTAVNVVGSEAVTLELDTGDLDVSAGDTVEYTVTAGDGSDAGELTIE